MSVESTNSFRKCEATLFALMERRLNSLATGKTHIELVEIGEYPMTTLLNYTKRNGLLSGKIDAESTMGL